MKTGSSDQLKQQRERWNFRAADWDESIKDTDHYVNFEDGYRRFLDFEKRELKSMRKIGTGLDIGCGTGITSAVLAKKVEKIYLLDLAEKMLEEAKKKVPHAIALHASTTSIPLPDGSVDVAVSRGVVVSHLPQGTQVDFFDELKRIIKPGGKVIIDFLSNINSADFPNTSPKIAFSKKCMREELESRDFAQIAFDGYDNSRVIRVSAARR